MISEKEQELLRTKYNPDGSNLRKAQLRMAEMLAYLDAICKKHNIPYWITAGTLLGAVRHGGFIPWDDDSDIYIMEKDFKKLIEILKKEKSEDFVWQDHDTDKNYFNFWGVLRDLKSEYVKDYYDNVHIIRKYRGLQVDVFPVSDKTYSTLWRINRKISYKILKLLNASNKKNIIKAQCWYFFNKILVFIFNCFGLLKFRKDKVRQTYGNWSKREYDKNVIFPLSRIIFEGIELNAPKDPHQFLVMQYGADYENVPSQDKIKNHNAKVSFS